MRTFHKFRVMDTNTKEESDLLYDSDKCDFLDSNYNIIDVLKYISEENKEYVDEIYKAKEWEYNVQNLLNRDNYAQYRIYLGDVCNFNCKYCVQNTYRETTIRKEKEGRNIDKILENIDKFFENEQNNYEQINVEFYGGEPLYYFQDIKIIKEHIDSFKKNTNYNITTNGSLLNDEITDYIIKNDMFLIVSWDGIKSDRTENILENENIVKCLKKIKEAYNNKQMKYDVQISNAISYTSKDFKENAEYVKKKLGEDFLISYNPVQHIEYTDIEETELFSKLYEDFNNDLFMFSYPSVLNVGCIIVNSIISKKKHEFWKTPKKCRALRHNLFTMNYNGDMIFCDNGCLNKGEKFIEGVENVYCDVNNYTKKPTEELLKKYMSFVESNCPNCLANTWCPNKCLLDEKNITCRHLEKSTFLLFIVVIKIIFGMHILPISYEKIQVEE